MKIYPQIKKASFLFLMLALLGICSCSNNVVQTSHAQLAIIFDYDSEDSLPKARFSVFVEAVSNPNRLESIVVKADKKEYIWESDQLIRAQTEVVKYCGLSNLVMPVDEKIPSGNYTITYYQADQEKKEMKATLSYNQDFYEAKVKDIPALMNKYMGARMLTIFGEDKQILYYGPRTSQFSDARGIWNEYRDAVEFQETWISSGGNIICNLPVEKVVPGN
ncbi:MAG: hypothetical protein K5907_07940 [Treponema sp.]|nr:hypothetical protein [Treponema sp.]